ncbi:MAG: NACHT domain-containing protein [Flavobacteriales bacterium]|nr:NACHT domain-containing protein [Flavobacteriales bacterium]
MNKPIDLNTLSAHATFFDVLKNGNSVLVLGAGFSIGVRNATNAEDLAHFLIPSEHYDTIPTGSAFVRLTNELFVEEQPVTKYQAAANLWETYEYKVGGIDLSGFFRNLFIPNKEAFMADKQGLYSSIFLPNWHGIFTFNFDTVLETIVDIDYLEPFYYSLWYPRHRGVLPRRDQTHITHLHGIITDEKLSNLVFGTRGYNTLRKEGHTLYDALHNAADEGLTLCIIGTQFDEETIDDKFFEWLRHDVTIFHFDQNNSDFRTKPRIIDNPNYHFIRIEDTADVLRFFKNHEARIGSHSLTDYLQQIIHSNEISKIDRLYVNLFGQESMFPDIESVGIEVLSPAFLTTYSLDESERDDYLRDVDVIEDENVDEIEYEDESIELQARPRSPRKPRNPKVDTILNLERVTQQFVIVGGPGSGKSTALNKILYKNCQESYRTGARTAVPILIPLNELKTDTSIKRLVCKKLKIDSCESLLREGRIQLLLDGLNEVDIDQREITNAAIQNLLDDYEKLSVIISTRKTGFINRFNIPVFEVKELQEFQIRSFLEKRLGDVGTATKVWLQLNGNKSLMDLAYNPMYLSMIVASSAATGRVPENRGSLFDVFVNTLLIREGEGVFETQAIKHVLARLAFYLKKVGQVSIPREKADRILNEDISKHVEVVNPIGLLRTITSCNLLTVTSTTSFVHEAFLDYFSALYIKETFNSLYGEPLIEVKDLGIENPADPIWYEPMVLAADLFTDHEQQAAGFFTLLFTNECHRNPVVRPLGDIIFDPSEWNQETYVACRVAFQFKGRFPKIYNQAEMFIGNCLSIWQINNRKGNEIFPLEALFRAIASLSSKKIFETILYSDSWQAVWLYSNEDDSPQLTISGTWGKSPEKYQILTDELVNHISDFRLFYWLLNEETLLNNCVFPVIRSRITRIGEKLLKSTSILNIKSVFLAEPNNVDLLKFIGSVDCSFFMEHYQVEKWGLEQYVDVLIDMIGVSEARDGLLSMFLEFGMELQIEIIEKFIDSENGREICDYLNNNFTKITLNEVGKDSIRNLLKQVQINDIPPTLHDRFFEQANEQVLTYNKALFLTANDGVPYVRFHIQNPALLREMKGNFRKVVLNESVTLSVLRTGSRFLGEVEKNTRRLDAESLAMVGKNPPLIIANLALIDRGGFKEIPDEGWLVQVKSTSNTVFNGHYKVLKRRDRTHAQIALSNLSNPKNLLDSNQVIMVRVNESINGRLHALSIEVPKFVELEKQTRGLAKLSYNERDLKVWIDIQISEEHSSLSIPKSGTIRVNNHLLYENGDIHPEAYVTKFAKKGSFETESLSPKITKDIVKLGLVHQFHKNINRVNYGVIGSVYKGSITVISLNNLDSHGRHKVVKCPLPLEMGNGLGRNQVVVIENNHTVGIVDQDDYDFGYLEEPIINIDYVRKEGHILKRNKELKDYYFCFEDCDFDPKLGDQVSFLPAANIIPSCFGLPQAYKISLVTKVRQCVISKVGFDGDKHCYSGKASDCESQQELSFTVLEYERFVWKHIKTGNQFSYRVVYRGSDSSSLIKLLEVMS